MSWDEDEPVYDATISSIVVCTQIVHILSCGAAIDNESHCQHSGFPKYQQVAHYIKLYNTTFNHNGPLPQSLLNQADISLSR
jgi:hypothetical protein